MKPIVGPALLIVCAVVAVARLAGPDPQPATDLPSAIRLQLNARAAPGHSEEAASLDAFYRSNGYHARWLGTRAAPDRTPTEALAALAAANDDGLEPADYGEPQLRRMASSLGERAPVPSLAAFDVSLSAAMLRYLRDLRVGRIDPRTLGIGSSPGPGDRDVSALLAEAVATSRIGELVARSRPQRAQYEALRTRLREYRALAADPAMTLRLPHGPAIRRGDAFAAAPLLWNYLEAVGDIDAGPPRPPAARYDGSLVEAVRRFQARHGLEVDGVLGKQTIAALNVPPGRRVRQIELALERLRWLPRVGTDRSIVVNVPMFRLWGWDRHTPDVSPAVAIGVIVGKAARTPTPVLAAEMREVIFRPYWNIPRSILVQEILPALARTPDYLEREDMEIVDGPGDAAPAVVASAENLERLRRGALRLRQRPGPRNALGAIKFVFPNDQDVYMHDTPARALFARPRRDFSHGCIRVEDPLSLAEWVLDDPSAWSRDRIRAAMTGAPSVRVPLPRPVGVLLLYTTAAVAPENGAIRFADDIYGEDARLDAALRVRRVLPEPHAARVDVHEVGRRVVADAALP